MVVSAVVGVFPGRMSSSLESLCMAPLLEMSPRLAGREESRD